MGIRFADAKKQVEATDGRVICEVAELAGLTWADQESVKSYLSRTHDNGVRRAWARYAVDSPRRFIIVGSTNHPTPLPNDRSGNRRFVVVPVEKASPQKVIEFWEENRDQVWAEAVHRYEEGFEAWLPHNLSKPAAKEAELYRSEDIVIEDIVATSIRNYPNGVSIPQILETFPELNISHQNRISSALQGQGFVKQRKMVGGVRRTMWVPKYERSH